MSELSEMTTIPAGSPDFLQVEGEMGALMRVYDWENHPLGNPENWSDSLKNIIQTMLNSAFPMFVWWTDELYMFHNDAYLPALGNKHPDALGASARDMWSEIWDDVGGVAEDILKNSSRFYAEDLKLMLERKGFPEETYWTFSYSPAFESGKVNGVFCACSEVTKTVLSQRRLRTLKEISDATALIQTIEQACQTVSDILNHNPNDIPFNLIYLFDKNGSEAKLMGRAGDFGGINVPEVLTSTKAAPNWMLDKIIENRQPIMVGEYSLEIAEQEIAPGFTVPNKSVILPVFRPGEDQIIGFCITGISAQLEYDTDYIGFHQLLIGQFATSITSVQAREEAMRHRQYLQNVFEQAPVGITILQGPDYIIDLANPGICELWGRKKQDILGLPVLDALPEVKDQGIKELLDGVYTTGVPFVANELPVMLERKGTMEMVYLNFVYHPMRDSSGSINGIIAVAIDISEQVEARKKIEGMNRELLSINADLDNFVYSASHDLKAPISNIEGLMLAFLDYLPEETLQDEQVQLVLKLIQGSIDRFKRAISDLTEVAKVQRQNTEDIAKLDLAQVVEDIKQDFESEIKRADAQVDLQLAADSVIEFSSKNARSIVYNLLSNALKYRSHVRKPHISISTETTKEFVILTVQDNGLGFDPADEDKIFSMFKRLHDHVEGTGVGLYIVKRIVENAGGRIELDSEEGTGSTFKVYFRRS